MSEGKFDNPAYRIETERLVVRCYDLSDAQLLAESISENVEHLKPWMPWAHDEPLPFEQKLQGVRRFRGKFDLQEDYIYGIFNSEETKLLGGTGLHTRLGHNQLEIGYWIHKDYINKGLVTESTAALIKVAFEILHVHRIEIHCDPANLASASIPRKLGFTHEGTLRAKTPFLDRWSDSMIWGLLEEEYPNSPSVGAWIKVFDANGDPLL
ncbi:MAG: N-acetyltransferase [Anaerolineales bacterium]|nr:GNAT family N-acetyltransferase [Anaerolineae bacterium]PWB73216.1 MAG: N-acetyltransferase [Anaerolineales bacterium]